MERRAFLQGGLGLGGLYLAAALAGCGPKGGGGQAKNADARTLKIIHVSNLSVLDPVFSTAPATKDYAYLTLDQLVALDADYRPSRRWPRAGPSRTTVGPICSSCATG